MANPIILRGKGQITLPQEIREAARLEEGDPLEVEMTDQGILLRPMKVIDATQSWFWTPAWQLMEAEADVDIASGRVDEHETAEGFLDSLDT
jgi:AbrB family looped-hinge helix DNA binding protein